MSIDPVGLTADLIRCPTVTPQEGGALLMLEALLEQAGFHCTRVDRNGTPNLFARWGGKGEKTFGFNGHTDVVPAGNPDDWSADPFGGEIRGGVMYGRGATDMKSAVAAFAAAAIDFVRDTPPQGAIILTLTGDEEGEASDGTVALLDWMDTHHERMDVCLVGEPTCPKTMGEMMKIGRRGSINAYFVARGVQGHVAYPHRAKNPLPALAGLMADLSAHSLDQGSAHFDPSTLAVTTIDVANPTTNLIPAEGRATVNIRFNDLHTGASLTAWLKAMAAQAGARAGVDIEVECRISGESFLTPPGDFVDLVARSIKAETGVTPELSTSGGTSDARFVKNHCPVVEFGLVGETMHKIDECVPVDQITTLKAVYARILKDYFA
ncbi:Succinyl-diaminopimelate desuccinylase [Aquimixticola soesokkakensis]|uniref:Succinyl-diaminopimelate desuccinylase n=1 Tax=Aquimixticola soesokkakensis TaxID=1519096 RepID=A0A1Y5REN5_9RHOB|nr:succinyl-diaminopimelate desuccinylase [Aquimixticola soesokkakensis]SLN14513.1 Succinyl-diaminopimelate desuccinylase [Aquimixticola soesokkakensis]